MSTNHVVIVAGGMGSRMGSALPKQFIELNGKPILMHTISAFWKYCSELHIVLSLAPDYRLLWSELCVKHQFNIPHQVVDGGETRFHSVKNGLCVIDGGCTAVHDAARPLVNTRLIREGFQLADKLGAAVPAIPITDSCRVLTHDGYSKPIDRTQVRRVQTPQVFDTNILKKAYMQDYSESFTDDASVVEALHPITLFEGESSNIKITHPDDLLLAQWWLQAKSDNNPIR